MPLPHRAAWILLLCLRSGSGARTSFYGAVGSNVTAVCKFSRPGSWRIFCRTSCSGGNILIETQRDRARSGRYSLGYERTGLLFQESVLSVGVSGLSRSDSGRYVCGLTSGGAYRLTEFHILAVDAVLEVNSQQKVFVEAGRSLTVACSFQTSGNPKYLSWKPFSREQVLVQTELSRTQEGRFSLTHEEHTGNGEVVCVSIEQLAPPDSGWYRCGMKRQFIDFQVVVTDASAGPTTESRSPPTVPELTAESGASQDHRPDVLLSVGPVLTAVVVLLGVALLIFCRKRASKHKDRLEGRDVSVTESPRLYEDVADGGPRVGTLSLTPRTGDGEDGYSVVTAPGLPLRVEDDSGGLVYSEVVFRQMDRPHGASYRAPADVVYSTARAARGSGDRPLYSTVSPLGTLEDVH
ncbi:uncharacterized protein LOC115408455 [Salarias fasciatus]|uniref:uncharacterized protein LOC115408455 n=1 Tax=Salarias fasciatus TaxID=181472 RepID=UPI001176547F|nr:uncharacterized protein LOC115408455 [Salarias fasciatus]